MSDKEFTYDNPRSAVEALIGGLSLTKIPEEKHRELLMPLSAAKNEAQSARNYPRVKKIQAIIAKLKLHPGETEEQIKSERARTQSEIVKSREVSWTNENTNNDAIIDELMAGRPMETVDSKKLPVLLRKLKNRRESAIEECDYRTCHKLETLIQQMNSHSLEAKYDEVRNEQLSSLQMQLMNANQDLEEAEAMWRQQTDEYNQKHAYNDTYLNEQQQQQVEDYDASFPDMLPVNFRKMSCNLLQVREQEKHLVLTRRFEEAIHMHDRADKMEMDELENQRQRFLKAFHTQRQQLFDGHASQRTCFDRNWQRKREVLESEMNSELKARRQLVTNLQRRIDQLESGPYEGDISPVAQKARAATSYSMRSVQLSTRRSAQSPAGVHPRVRSVAASRINRRPVFKKNVV